MKDDIGALIARTHDLYEKRGLEPVRFFPADFMNEGEHAAYAVPFPPDARWRSLESLIDLFNPKTGVLLLAPLFWQTEPWARDALRAHGVPIASLHGGNMPVALEIVRQIRAQGAIVDGATLHPFLAALKDAGLTHDLSFILSFSSLATWHEGQGVLDPGPLVFREIHIAPGIPLLYQRPSEAGSDRYVRSAAFRFEEEDGASYVTALAEDVPPCVRFRLPFALLEERETGLVTIRP